jgi:hypothetical protein
MNALRVGFIFEGATDEDTIPVIIGIAVLAQPDVLESVLWDPLSPQDRARCGDPESIPHPKNEIVRRYNGGDDLSRQQAQEIAEHLDFQAIVIEQTCPSFARFAQDIRVLIAMQ